MRSSRAWTLVAAIGFLLPAWACGGDNLALVALAQTPEDAKPASAPLKKLAVRVLDPEGNPVAGAHVGLAAHFGAQDEPKKPADTDSEGFVYEWHRLTNSRGVAEIEAGGADLRPLLEDQGIVARQEKRHLVALVHLDPAKLKDTVDVALAPECRVSGKVICLELQKDKKPLGSTTVSLGDGDHVALTCTSDGRGDYHFFVPPGRYLLDAVGNNIFQVFAAIEVPAAAIEGPAKEHELVFEPMVAPVGKRSLLEGQPAPELRGAVAWKNGPPVTLASLKGKCVLLFFWRASSPDSLAAVPAIFDLYDKLKKYGLVVVGVDVDVDPDKKPVDSVQKLDEMLAKVKTDTWKGRDIPFPVAIVPPRPTVFGPSFPTSQFADSLPAADYGVTDYPTVLLIDRHGVLVSELDDSAQSLALLQKTLGLKVTPTPRSPSHPPAAPPAAKAPSRSP